jgi:hypothetical protein
MKPDDVMRKELTALLASGNAHEGFETKVAGFPAEHINSVVEGVVRPGNVPLTPYALLEHMRIALHDIVEFIRDPDFESPPYPEGYWPDPEVQADAEQWRKTLDNYRTDLETLTAIVNDPSTDLLASIPHAPDYTIFREVLTIADHNSYHIGQFGIFGDYFGHG